MAKYGTTTSHHGPRITALPGPARLARVSEATWGWMRSTMLGAENLSELTGEQIRELETVGILVDDPQDEAALVVEPHWEQFLRAGLTAPIGIELVCVDGSDAWTTTLRIAGRFVMVIDQEREVESDPQTVRLGRRSSGVILGVTTIEHLSATVEALVPQRPAFTDAAPLTAPSELVDAPAVAEVQMLVIASPTRERTVTSGGSWYAYGEQGEQLAVLVTADDGVQARELEPGSLTTATRAKVIAAIDHVTAVASELGSVA